jgi:hypothetical protein
VNSVEEQKYVRVNLNSTVHKGLLGKLWSRKGTPGVNSIVYRYSTGELWNRKKETHLGLRVVMYS